jgi:hypothetical protein
MTNDPGFCPDCGVIRSMFAPSNCKTPQCHWVPRHDSRKVAPTGIETNRDLRVEITILRAELAASAEVLEMVDAAIKYWCDGSMNQIIQSDLLNRAAHCAAAAKRAREASKQ